MKKNSVGELVVDEEDLINSALEDKSVKGLLIVDKHTADAVKEYIQHAKKYGFSKVKYQLESDLSLEDYQQSCRDAWQFPEQYQQLDVEDYISKLATTKEEKDRVNLELELFKTRGMLNVLCFMIYFVDTCRENKLVWGVGRGSSVASYVLYLIGVHKINSLKYNLDIREFLK